ncbi:MULTISPECIES: hypothetical protein [Ruegeria]|uniref:hypothetical protein n=1 Tax=Ruegeria TaxID=97050 RepID=UPI00147E191A|nr:MULTISPECIES: hypothetical protein [Ruegeria]UUV05122.1 hypothetical protein NOR97_10815 [Ruegeria sp. YS9]
MISVADMKIMALAAMILLVAVMPESDDHEHNRITPVLLKAPHVMTTDLTG